MRYQQILSKNLNAIYLVGIPETATDNQMPDWDIVILEQHEQIKSLRLKVTSLQEALRNIHNTASANGDEVQFAKIKLEEIE